MVSYKYRDFGYISVVNAVGGCQEVPRGYNGGSAIDFNRIDVYQARHHWILVDAGLLASYDATLTKSKYQFV